MKIGLGRWSRSAGGGVAGLGSSDVAAGVSVTVSSSRAVGLEPLEVEPTRIEAAPFNCTYFLPLISTRKPSSWAVVLIIGRASPARSDGTPRPSKTFLAIWSIGNG